MIVVVRLFLFVSQPLNAAHRGENIMIKALFIAAAAILFATTVWANCVYDGKEYSDGASITTEDGSYLTCSCDSDGKCSWN